MTARDRRALAAGAAIVGAAVLLLRVGPWAWGGYVSARQSLAQRAELLVRMHDEVRGVAALEDSGSAARKTLAAMASKVLAGRAEADAAADLGGRVTSVAGHHRVRLDRTESVPDSARAGELRRVSLRVGLESDSRGVFELLAALGREPAALELDDLQLTAADPASPGDVAEVVRAELTVRGWYLPAERAR